jgi:hypothetical protein
MSFEQTSMENAVFTVALSGTGQPVRELGFGEVVRIDANGAPLPQ